MTYAEARAWLDRFVNLERRPDPASWTTLKLERVERLLALLGHPERHGRVVHIAGSKGKGSTAAMVDAVLRAAGCRTGLYTSPDLRSRRERMRVDGQPISREEVALLVAARLKPAAEAYARAAHGDSLTFFDLHTALAFLWFAESGVDWSVVEVGLGGRLDATNVVAPRITAITSLSLEHTAFLGSTLTAIAREKAGIIKPGVPVVCAPQPPEAMAQIQRIAADRGAPVLLADGADPVPDGAFVELADGGVGQRLRLAWDDGTLETLLPLLGSHQAVNCAVARTVLANLARRRLALVTRTALDAGLRGVRWPGRVQVLERAPWLVLDGAHTPDSAARLNETLALFPHRRRWLVVGVARDKDLEGFLAELAPSAAGLALTSVPDHPRMAPADTLAPVASRYAARVAVTPDPAAALGLARTWAAPDDLIVVTGSLFLVGEVLTMLQGPAA